MADSNRQQLWVMPAMVEEGSFCSLTSGLHYDSLTNTEADEAIATAEARGDDVSDFRDTGEGENIRNNCTITQVDRVGYDYPARYRPGE